MKRYLFAFLAAAAVSSAAFAQSSPDSSVKSAVEGTVNAMKADKTARSGDMAKITQVVETHFVPYTDFLRTTRIAVGKAWNTATPEQHVTFKFEPSNTAVGAKDTVVQSHVVTNGGDDSVGYRLEKTANGWKIY